MGRYRSCICTCTYVCIHVMYVCTWISKCACAHMCTHSVCVYVQGHPAKALLLTVLGQQLYYQGEHPPAHTARAQHSFFYVPKTRAGAGGPAPYDSRKNTNDARKNTPHDGGRTWRWRLAEWYLVCVCVCVCVRARGCFVCMYVCLYLSLTHSLSHTHTHTRTHTHSLT